MEAFNIFHDAAWGLKTHIKFDDLPIGNYRISHFSVANTTFGPTLKAEIGENFVFLPKRFYTQLNREDIAGSVRRLNNTTYVMKYRGKDPARRNM